METNYTLQLSECLKYEEKKSIFTLIKSEGQRPPDIFLLSLTEEESGHANWKVNELTQSN